MSLLTFHQEPPKGMDIHLAFIINVTVIEKKKKKYLVLPSLLADQQNL